MRTDRGWGRVYATGWLVSAGITLVAGRMWQLHLHEVEQRAEEAERTRRKRRAGGPWKNACVSPGSCMIP
jgi:hypothetical protein